MKKRLLQMFFLCLPLAVLLTVSAGAVIASGTWEDVTWSISDSGQLTIGSTSGILKNGEKPMSDGEGYIISDWAHYAEQTTSIVIENGVTQINDGVFGGRYDNVKELFIPESVTVLEDRAFGYFAFTGLKKATIPASCLSRQGTLVQGNVTLDGLIRPLSRFGDTLEEIIITGNAADLDKSVFEGYQPASRSVSYGSLSFGSALKKVTFPKGLTTIWNGAFEDCTGLTEITIPEGVTNIGVGAFRRCSNLKSITLPSSLTSIDGGAFSDSGLTEIIIPPNVTSIGNSAFSECKQLKKVILPEGLTSIENYTFSFCMNLEEITIPVSVTSIGTDAFMDYRYDKTDSHLGKMRFTVYYEGSEEQWKQVKGSNDDYLTSASIRYNSPMPVITPTTAPPVESNAPAFTDVPREAYYWDPVQWAVDHGVTKGVSETNFAPADTCTRGQVATFLWRAKGCPEPATTVNPFTDVDPSSAFYKAILWAAENGVTAGTSDTTFSPGNPCTRAHVVTFLWRAQGKPAATGAAPLADSFPQGYYTDAVRWADAAGLLDGTGEAFAPSALCPRADIVTYLYRNLA